MQKGHIHVSLFGPIFIFLQDRLFSHGKHSSKIVFVDLHFVFET